MSIQFRLLNKINNESSLFHYDLSSKWTQAGSDLKLEPVLNRPLTRAERWNMQYIRAGTMRQYSRRNWQHKFVDMNNLRCRVVPETPHYLRSGGSSIPRRWSSTQSEAPLE